jgi:hypothetical protein
MTNARIHTSVWYGLADCRINMHLGYAKTPCLSPQEIVAEERKRMLRKTKDVSWIDHERSCHTFPLCH